MLFENGPKLPEKYGCRKGRINFVGVAWLEDDSHCGVDVGEADRVEGC